MSHDRTGLAFATITEESPADAAAMFSAQQSSLKAPARAAANLSFTNFHTERRSLSPWWAVSHSMDEQWEESMAQGSRFFDEVALLAAVDEVEAFSAMRYAPCAANWGGGFGAEHAFSEAVAAAAIVGLQAIRAGARPFAIGDYGQLDGVNVRVRGNSDLETAADGFTADERLHTAWILSAAEHERMNLLLGSVEDGITRLIGEGQDNAHLLWGLRELVKQAQSIVGEV
jgi:hypothetical protein